MRFLFVLPKIIQILVSMILYFCFTTYFNRFFANSVVRKSHIIIIRHFTFISDANIRK